MKRKAFFDRFNCDVCKSKATMFRLIKDDRYMLCDRKNCELYTRIKSGFFSFDENLIEAMKSKTYGNIS